MKHIKYIAATGLLIIPLFVVIATITLLSILGVIDEREYRSVMKKVDYLVDLKNLYAPWPW